MKTAEEMAQSALKRIKEYKEKEKKRKEKINKIIKITSGCCLSVLLIVTVLIIVNNTNISKIINNEESVLNNDTISTEKVELNETSVGEDLLIETTKSEESSEDLSYLDTIGIINIDDKSYFQFFPEDNEYTKGEYLGKASGFEGTYKNITEIDGDVYQSNENDEILIVYLTNDGIVYLKNDNNHK